MPLQLQETPHWPVPSVFGEELVLGPLTGRGAVSWPRAQDPMVIEGRRWQVGTRPEQEQWAQAAGWGASS